MKYINVAFLEMIDMRMIRWIWVVSVRKSDCVVVRQCTQ